MKWANIFTDGPVNAVSWDDPFEMQIMAEDEDLIPSYAHEGDAGMDLRAARPGFIMPGEIYPVDTGLNIAVPAGFVGFVNPRSGLGSKGISVANTPGTIDSGYRGPLKVLLINHSPDKFTYGRGDRIAQLVILPILRPTIRVVEEFRDKTDRGSNGFGSTGVG